MTKTTKIAALGYYGFGNLGDEAVLAGIRQALGEKISDSDLLVLSNNPSETKRLHPGVRAIDRWKWREVAASLRQTDLFVFGGGSLLQDATSVKSVVWYALMALLARRRARRVLWWGQGIGPLNSSISRRMVRLIASQADALTVRDTASAELLREIGVEKPVEIVADPAFALKPSNQGPTIGKNRVFFAPRHWKDDVVGNSIRDDAGFWRKLEAKAGGSTLILPMHLHQSSPKGDWGDAEYASSLLPEDGPDVWHWNVEGRSVVQTLGLVAEARAMVAMRLHALIFAARCGVPFVALSYDPKVNALSAAAGQEDVVVPVESFTVETLLSAVERMTETYGVRREQLRTFSAAQIIKSVRPAEIAADLL